MPLFELVLEIGLGAAAFILLFGADLCSLRSVPAAKPLLWGGGGALFTWALVRAAGGMPRVALPAALPAAGWVLAALFLLLLVYSLFLEIPFASAYVGPGGPARLVSSGTYALCRHPGVLWQAGLLAGLFAATGSLRLLAAFPVWTGLNALYVLLQERLVFGHLFGEEYRRYQQAVPMLLPTRASLGRCLRTLFANRMKA